jgi:hypothetical protein
MLVMVDRLSLEQGWDALLFPFGLVEKMDDLRCLVSSFGK